ncbi:MAG: hypothetical protein ACM3QU_15745 [Verrucomicrobiota bacterium]
MRVGICEWTTFPASFEDELASHRAAGAGAIGILEPTLDGVPGAASRAAVRALEAMEAL